MARVHNRFHHACRYNSTSVFSTAQSLHLGSVSYLWALVAGRLFLTEISVNSFFSHPIRISVLPLCSLCLCGCVSCWDRFHHRDTESTEVTQRKFQTLTSQLQTPSSPGPTLLNSQINSFDRDWCGPARVRDSSRNWLLISHR